jgi:hypothetical protein
MFITYTLSGLPTLDDINLALDFARANGNLAQGRIAPIRVCINDTYAAGSIALAAALKQVVDRVGSFMLVDSDESLAARDLDPVCCGVKEFLATFDGHKLDHRDIGPGLWEGDGLKFASPHAPLQLMDGLSPRYAA